MAQFLAEWSIAPRERKLGSRTDLNHAQLSQLRDGQWRSHRNARLLSGLGAAGLIFSSAGSTSPQTHSTDACTAVRRRGPQFLCSPRFPFTPSDVPSNDNLLV